MQLLCNMPIDYFSLETRVLKVLVYSANDNRTLAFQPTSLGPCRTQCWLCVKCVEYDAVLKLDVFGALAQSCLLYAQLVLCH